MGYSRYDWIACISHGTRDALAAWLPQLSSSLAVVPNGSVPVFDNHIKRENEGCLNIISVGRLEYPKNYGNILEALSFLKDLNWSYTIAGEGAEASVLKKKSKDLDLAGRVHFAGYVENVSDLLKASDLFLIPSRWEGFGLAAVEAMNASLPIVASEVDGLREVVGENGECGVLVDPQSPSSIADGTQGMLLDKVRRHRCGEKAFCRSHEFSADRMVDDYGKLYKTLV